MSKSTKELNDQVDRLFDAISNFIDAKLPEPPRYVTDHFEEQNDGWKRAWVHSAQDELKKVLRELLRD